VGLKKGGKGEKGKRGKKPGLSFAPNIPGDAQGNNSAEDFGVMTQI